MGRALQRTIKDYNNDYYILTIYYADHILVIGSTSRRTSKLILVLLLLTIAPKITPSMITEITPAQLLVTTRT